MKLIELRYAAPCPHCDKPLKLYHIGVADGLRYICESGCKAEYSATLTVGVAVERPICGASRVHTRQESK